MDVIVGTGKTLLARAVAKQLDANFLKVVSSAIVDKYIGESARLIREMFGKRDINDCFVTLLVFNRAAYAKDHQPCIIFMDEIDAIGKREREGKGETEDMLFLLSLFLHQVVRGFLRVRLLIVRYNGH